jgi:NTP pyrophosphatase (non-canonical NTP hydrolase)
LMEKLYYEIEEEGKNAKAAGLIKKYDNYFYYLQINHGLSKLNINEAQKYSYHQFQDHNERLGKTWTPFTMTTKMLEEAGEVAEVVLGLEGIKPKGSYSREMLGRELSDLMYNVFIIAETYDIDLDSVYRQTIDKYAKLLFKE